MELSERCIQTLEKEGFNYVYETQDAPEAIYEEHVHKGKVTIFVTEGAFEITVAGQVTNLVAGERYSIPPTVPYSAVVGSMGCQLVIGEEIDGDF
jgi:quercetin dioxygenase-like cupin family protein